MAVALEFSLISNYRCKKIYFLEFYDSNFKNSMIFNFLREIEIIRIE